MNHVMYPERDEPEPDTSHWEPPRSDDDTRGEAGTSSTVPRVAAPRPEGPFPQTFGRYELRDKLGEGGMGTVYLAFDTRLEIEVALKVPHPHVIASPANRERFYREARAAARLEHPNLCRVLDVAEQDGVHHLTMRYVPGAPLSKLPPPEPDQAAELVHTLTTALAAAHRLGVVHRDLKPSNVLVTPDGSPVVTDFGLALRLNVAGERMTLEGVAVGTPQYMSPEQFAGDLAQVGPASDVYSLGVILYELLTGRLPFEGAGMWGLMEQVMTQEPAPPRLLRPDLDPALEAFCLRAMAKRVEDRFADMDEFGAALADYLAGAGRSVARVPLTRPTLPPSGRPTARRPPVARSAVRFAFVGLGERAAATTAGRDRIYLDVGNDLRPGVLDHHHRVASAGSTASLVLAHPDLVAAALNPLRKPDDPFFVVTHEKPDLDSVASAYLVVSYLTTGDFPAGADVLARYVDKVDEGVVGMTLANPFALYSAGLQAANRLLRQSWNSGHERWQEYVRVCLEVVDFVVGRVVRDGTPLPEVDAFACPGHFTDEDRREVHLDVERYLRKLADPRTRARRDLLRLPGQFGGTVEAEALRVRDVQNGYDPERVLFFKDWARSDAQRCANGKGFVALSVFMTEGPGQVRRCVLSVRPDSGASLRGLGALLDDAEAARRRQVFGEDDRVTDPATGQAKAPRPGYANADPWYDGRAHGYTIVDSPRSGTLLTADEVEALFLKFGGCEPPSRTPAVGAV